MIIFDFMKKKRRKKESQLKKSSETGTTVNGVSFWKEKIIFCDGWFIYLDGKGNNSVISHKCARQIELSYQRYQASMDINRGDSPDDIAYAGRGFRCVNGEYVYENYRVDKLIDNKIATIEEVLKIPDEINGIRINCIAKRAFENEIKVEKIILPESIQKIGDSAFADCINLSEIEIPSEYVSIGNNAFKNTAFYCENKTTYLNNTLMKVAPSFSGALKINKGTTSIADNALQGCSELEEVIFPSELISIGRYAFEGCSKIKRISLPSSVQKIGTSAFKNCKKLTDVVFPQNMDTIEMGAFARCIALKSIDLPDGILTIERALFSGCENLLNVHIPDSVTKICFDAFEKSGFLENYKNSKEKELYVDKWLISYKGYDGKTLRIKEGTIGIADMDFLTVKKVSAVHFPNSLKYIGSDTFRGAELNLIELSENLCHIGQSAFRGTKIKEILIPESVDIIEEWAFMGCEELKKITVKGCKTNIIFPAITERKDKEIITIYAPNNPSVKEYCEKYGKKYNLIFKLQV